MTEMQLGELVHAVTVERRRSSTKDISIVSSIGAMRDAVARQDHRSRT